MHQPLLPSSKVSEAKYQEVKEVDPHRLEVEDHQDPSAHQEVVPQQEEEAPLQEDTELVEDLEEDQEEEEN
jgi:hypothetical protein